MPGTGPPVTDRLPEPRTLAGLRAAAATCRACPLFEKGTQTVFGEGSEHARVVLIGEQPGDREDKAGHPFVGPAGAVLHRGLEAAGIDPGLTYITGVVKHFNWRPRGRRRIHQNPSHAEIEACLPWGEAEVDVVRPELLVCLGATAAQALLGPDFKVTQHRGEIAPTRFGPPALVTVHPSSVLRTPPPLSREEAMEAFVSDLRGVAQHLARGGDERKGADERKDGDERKGAEE
jgi:uracil-DNA glycosylase family protein